jgi:acyl-CoA synthetase (AMP-forming)/AMP-acid ligase II
LTEFAYVTNATHEDSIRKPNTVGRVSTGLEIKLVDDDDAEVPNGQIGEILVRGESGTLGYYNDAETTAKLIDKENWYHTGDLAYKDEEGYYFFCDRKKDMLRRSGENISSAELEGILLRHPDIADVAIIGVPDRIRGQEVKAYIVPNSGVSLSPEAVWAHCEKEMAYYKIPRYLEFRESLPKTKTQKTQKFVLRKEKGDLTEGCFDRTKQ